MTIQRFHVGDRLSEMAVHQGTVYLAGQVAEDLTGDIAHQTRDVLAAIDRLLVEAGTDKSHILMAMIYMKDIREFPAMNAVWDVWVAKGHAPPRATVEAALFNPSCLIEVVVTAARP